MANESDFIDQLISETDRDKAFKKLLDLYQVRLYWHIRKLVITHENADDVLQNTFIRVYKSLTNFSRQSSLYTWMYKIAYNESIRFLEQNKNKHSISIEDVNTKYLNSLLEDTFFEGDVMQLKLQTAVSELNYKQRQVFNMKYYDDLKFREIATILEMKEGTIKTLYYNAVRFIEDNIEILPIKKGESFQNTENI
ncbi:RNA polymerase sigma factor [Flavobacterium sufflavum]|uniref:RNA polymerase sigma factor n=1 Tax=Flavobacterium sufflavum TaxID=1921138 RepID=A0A437L418_9FLAO|nr:RNA polymerase sigma factor [Flavobacterium sufflavum]RVT80038.1 RNA polymerase sigma factor [Flavobacterium sufflavum]